MPAFSAQRFRDRRAAAGLSRPQLAALTPYQAGTIKAIERGLINPSVAGLCIYATALQCSVADFFDADIQPQARGGAA